MHADEPQEPDDDGTAPAAGAAPLRLVPPRASAGAAAPTTEALARFTLAVAREHDRTAFSALFEHFAPRLKHWLVRTGSTPEIADELVQDSFVALWRKAAQYDPARATVAAWLFTIARNLRVDRHRGLCDTWVALDDAALDRLPDPAPPQDECLLARQHERRVHQALALLTHDQRALVHLSFFEDKSHACIAGELHLPLGTVKTRLRRAAARLRELLVEARP